MYPFVEATISSFVVHVVSPSAVVKFSPVTKEFDLIVTLSQAITSSNRGNDLRDDLARRRYSPWVATARRDHTHLDHWVHGGKFVFKVLVR